MKTWQRIRRVLGSASPVQTLDGLQTLDRAISRGQSIVRFGDGEMAQVFPGIVRRGLLFQRRDPALTRGLRRLLEQPDPRVLVCFNNTFTQLREVPIVLDFERSKKAYSSYLSVRRTDDVGVLTGRQEQYTRWFSRATANFPIDTLGEAMCFFLSIYADAYREGTLDLVLAAYRKLLAGRTVLFVAPRNPLHGASFRDLVEQRIIRSPSEVDFIDIPEQNCFEHRASIIREVVGRPRPDAVFLQAGPTATVLAHELATQWGITAYDVGSLNTSLQRAHAVTSATF